MFTAVNCAAPITLTDRNGTKCPVSKAFSTYASSKLKGIAFVKQQPDQNLVYLPPHLTWNTEAVVVFESWTLTNTQQSLPTWAVELSSHLNMHGLENELESNSTPLIWGILSSPLHDSVALAISLVPKHALDYTTSSHTDTYVIIVPSTFKDEQYKLPLLDKPALEGELFQG
jgi:hypothetical protein